MQKRMLITAHKIAKKEIFMAFTGLNAGMTSIKKSSGEMPNEEAIPCAIKAEMTHNT